MKIDILGVHVDSVSLDQATSQVEQWVKEGGRHYIVTPNPEIIIAAQGDYGFRKILNDSDLAIPDSPRLNWGAEVLNSKNLLSKLSVWIFFFLPQTLGQRYLPTTTGIDLTERLIELSFKKGYRIGFLGGKEGVAEKLRERLSERYKNLNLIICTGKIKVDKNGDSRFDNFEESLIRSKQIKELPEEINQQIDILFVGLGAIKQEKWIARNLPKLNSKVMIGVGGAIDYLSEQVPRAPELIRTIGFEWLFRLIIQPWRIKRFSALLKFIFLILLGSTKT